MENVLCEKCSANLVVIEDSLFFKGDKTDVEIKCPSCMNVVDKRSSDGWFFVQTVNDYYRSQESRKSG